jgi:hypothetical protein
MGENESTTPTLDMVNETDASVSRVDAWAETDEDICLVGEEEDCVTSRDGVSVNLTSGTALSATFVNTGQGWVLSFKCDPPVPVEVDWMPDVDLHGLSYNLGTGGATPEITGLGPFNGVLEGAVADVIQGQVNSLLPPSMQGGWDPSQDLDLAGTLSALKANVKVDESTLPTGDSLPIDAISEAGASARVHLGEYAVDLGEGKMLTIASGTSLNLSMALDDPSGTPTLQHATIDATSGEIEVSANDKALLWVNRVSVGKGPSLSVDAVSAPAVGVAGLIALAGEMVGLNTQDYANDAAQSVNDPLVGLIEERGTAILSDLISQNDSEINGVSLRQLFGM